MEKINCTWKRNEARFANGVIAYVGKWPVASVNWAMSADGENKNWEVIIHLPGIKSNHGRYETLDQAKYIAEIAVNRWFCEAK